ncbi:MAG: hypothetical protein M1825_006329 [Sarcosagium campestre]|nr:MAG: hypothetical protein M1825_006329 [Sarcosagium campestre]
MADELVTHDGLKQVVKPVTLVPVGLKEAALDSPTFRATAVHFSDQVDLVEKWLEGYVKSTGKLIHEVSALEDLVNSVLARSVPPAAISEAVFDHDYTLLAVKRHAEGAREFWSHTISSMRKMDTVVVEPIRAFVQGELRNFKEAKKYFDQAQKNYDSLIARYASQAKMKEPSALREDAFQLYEARKSYLRASMEFSVLAPQVRSTLDKILVRVFSDQWQDLKKSRESLNLNSAKWGNEMERVRSWSIEMEAGERAFKRELQNAGRILEEKAALACRPSRELDDYAPSNLGSKGPSTMNLRSASRVGSRSAEKQGWLFLRTLTGKPTRTVWIRRWFFVKNGIFGWLVQGSRSGGVEESDRIGVLLCNVKQSGQEERRFCFEVKTKDNAILVQAETQSELTDWVETFEAAKRKSLEDTSGADSPSAGFEGRDAAFAISPPLAPEFAAKPADTHGYQGNNDDLPGGGTFDRSTTLPIPDPTGGLGTRSSFDVTAARKLTGLSERDGEGSRDHASRIIQKLDLHRKSNAGSQLSASPGGTTSSSALGGAPGGIASLISASHNILPVYTTGPGHSGQSPGHQHSASEVTLASVAAVTAANREVPFNSLAPSTLANPPAPTNLSKTAVVVSGERGIGVGRSDNTGGMPSGIMANMWGSSNWGYINRLERGELKHGPDQGTLTPTTHRTTSDASAASAKSAGEPAGEGVPPATPVTPVTPGQRPASKSVESSVAPQRGPVAPIAQPPGRHRSTISLDFNDAKAQRAALHLEEFPPNYPVQLKTQEAQFRMFFPNVQRSEKLLLVFRATWNPNDQQEFPGRVYVTPKDVYFYSHHLGLVLTSGISLASVDEVTAAPGKECDYLFLHFKEGTSHAGFSRVTIKIFLGDLRLLQRRLNLLVSNANSGAPVDLQTLLNQMIKLESDDGGRSPSLESWEEVPIGTPIDNNNTTPTPGRSFRSRRDRDLRTTLRIDRELQNDARRYDDSREVTKFKLPSQPVQYQPANLSRVPVERNFDVSPKALFHVLFGDKSAVFQILYKERRAQRVRQTPWRQVDEKRARDFEYQIDYISTFGRTSQARIIDSQSIDILDDHLCYVVTDKKTPWHLPYRENFMLVSKIVITHVAKSKCKLSIYTDVQWSTAPPFSRGLVEKQAFEDLDRDAFDLAGVLTDQVRRLGAHSRTKKAIQIFGHVGQHDQIPEISVAKNEVGAGRRVFIRQRTLGRMVLETLGSLAESAVSSLMIWTFAVLRGIWKISNAHSIILTVLALSVLTNLVYSSRDTSQWWRERSAGKFMARLGVHPNTRMSKAIWVNDLETVAQNQTNYVQPASSDRCYTTFHNLASLSDLSASSDTASVTFSAPSTRKAAKRLRRTRHRLASYRHDLLVAMRVVNTVEREMMLAEWETWLEDELTKCEQVGHLLAVEETARASRLQSSSSSSTSQSSSSIKADIPDESDAGDDLKGIKSWYQGYCQSCREEQALALSGRERLV